MKIKAKKSLGQNFLLDKNILKKIVEVGNIKSSDVVLEIGPGTGNLTEHILDKKPKQIYVIEKDSTLSSMLIKKFNNHINIINKDILDCDYFPFLEKKIIIFGNLPYNISTKIFSQLICKKKLSNSYKNLILMFQKEVADRILAKTNSSNYGRLSVLSNWKLDVKKIQDINPESFYPIPKIKSTLLIFEPKKKFISFKNPDNLELITRIFFKHRRKMIKNPLKQIFKKYDYIVEKLNLNINLRPQNLSPETYFKLTREFEELTN